MYTYKAEAEVPVGKKSFSGYAYWEPEKYV
jgi:hypothetical protein